jgi:hypothetical protein
MQIDSFALSGLVTDAQDYPQQDVESACVLELDSLAYQLRLCR